MREAPIFLGGENDYHDTKRRLVMHSLIESFGLAAMCNWVLGGAGGLPLLGSSKVTKSHKTSKARGMKGLSRYGGKMIRNAIALLEREAGKDSLTFATLTVPDCPLKEYMSLAASWAEVLRQLQQWLKRKLTAKQLRGEVVAVSEVQTERYGRTGIPALHLHLLFQGRGGRKSAWVITPKSIRKAWKRIIQPYLPSAQQWNALENLQRVKKSAGAYMAKYMSKGTGVIERMVSDGLECCIPSAWWNCTFSLRRRVLELSPCGSVVGNFIVSCIDSGNWDWLSYVFPIRLTHPLIGDYTIGYAGRIKTEFLSSFLSDCKDLKVAKRPEMSLLTGVL